MEKIIRRIARRNKEFMNEQDLIQIGRMAVKEAKEKFEPEKGGNWNLFAGWLIRKRIFDAIRKNGNLIHIPQRVFNKMIQIRRITKEFYLKEGRFPSIKEISTLTKTPLFLLKQIQRMEIESLDNECLSNDSTPNDEIREASIRKLALEILEFLPNKEASKIVNYFGIEHELFTGKKTKKNAIEKILQKLRKNPIIMEKIKKSYPERRQ